LLYFFIFSSVKLGEVEFFAEHLRNDGSKIVRSP